MRTKPDVKCEYRSGGVCVHHGPGAKPNGMRIELNKDGTTSKRCNKEYFYVCDLAPRGRGKLQQIVLSFSKTTPGRKNTLVFGTKDDKNITHSVGKQ